MANEYSSDWILNPLMFAHGERVLDRMLDVLSSELNVYPVVSSASGITIYQLADIFLPLHMFRELRDINYKLARLVELAEHPKR